MRDARFQEISRGRRSCFLKETPVLSIQLQKHKSGVIRRFEVEGYQFSLMTTKKGGSALAQYY